ncbi:hypothetical protein COBT_000504 [Conglomerata obtusa]
MASQRENLSALILVGGYGTRLRPLTLTVPKPLVPFANKPILVHQIEALYKAGVNKIILATSSREPICDRIKEHVDFPDLEIIFSYEDRTLGTAGPIRLAKNHLNYPCYVLNSDITCDFPFEEMFDYHISKNKKATILATNVKDPSKYGVMVVNSNGDVVEFVEKPKEFVSNRINAGVYIINEDVIEKIPMGEVSIEKDVFPSLARENELCAFDLTGYWMDIGQPKDYIEGVRLYLLHAYIPFGDRVEWGTSNFYRSQFNNVSIESLIDKKTKDNINFYEFNSESLIDIENSLIDKSVQIGTGSVIGPNVVIGKNVKIGKFVKLKECTIFDNVIIGDASYISKSLVGWGSQIGKWVRIDDISVLGSKVFIDNFLLIRNAKIMPGKRIVANEIIIEEL